MKDWQQKYDEDPNGWLECLEYLSKRLPRETYLDVYKEVEKLFLTTRQEKDKAA